MMKEILTRSGAVIHIDDTNRAQMLQLEIVVMALGGVAVMTELS